MMYSEADRIPLVKEGSSGLLPVLPMYSVLKDIGSFMESVAQTPKTHVICAHLPFPPSVDYKFSFLDV